MFQKSIDNTGANNNVNPVVSVTEDQYSPSSQTSAIPSGANLTVTPMLVDMREPEIQIKDNAAVSQENTISQTNDTSQQQAASTKNLPVITDEKESGESE